MGTYLSIGSVTTSEPTKAAVKGKSFPTDQPVSIGIFLEGADYTDAKYKNIKCTKTTGGGSWTIPETELLESAATLYAYYPYKEGITDVELIPVASSVCGDDWMWAEPVGNVSKTNPTVNLKFTHALALVEIKFDIYGFDHTLNNLKMTDIKFYGEGFKFSGALDATDGTLTPDSDAAPSETSPLASPTELKLSVSDHSVIADGLLVPVDNQGTARTITISCSFGAKTRKATVPGVIISPNTKSTILLNIKDADSQMEVVSVGVDQWDDKVDGNSAEMIGHTVTFNCPEGFNYDLEIKHEATAFFDEQTESAMRSSVIFRYEKKELTGSRFFFISEPSGCKIAHDAQNNIIAVTDLTQDVTIDVGYGTYIPYTATAEVEPTDKDAFGFPYDEARSTFNGGSGKIAILGELETIGRVAFDANTSLTGVDLSGCENLKTIKEYAFNGCTKLTSVKLPEGLETIEKNVFWHMGVDSDAQPRKITFPSTLKSIGNWAFEQARISGIDGFGDDFVSFGQGSFKSALMSSLDLSKCSALTAIPESCFEQCDNLASVDMSGCTSLKTVGKVGFAYSDKLTSVVLPQGLKTIGEKAFKDCASLTEMTLKSDPVPSLANDALSGTDLSAVYVNKSATGHGTLLGYKKADIWKDIPNAVIRETGTTVTLIPYTASAKINLKTGANYSLGTNTEYVSDESCSRYDSGTGKGEWFIIGQGSAVPTKIPAEMFKVGSVFDQAPLQSIRIPEGVETIGAQAFCNCSNLTSVSFPTTLATIEEYGSISYAIGAFDNCLQLQAIDLSGCANLKKIPIKCFYSCTRVTSLKLPDNLESIGQEAFNMLGSNSEVESLILPASLTSLGYRSFDSSKIKTVTLYSNLNSSRNTEAFYDGTVTNVIFEDGSNPANTMFWKCGITTITSKSATPPVLCLESGNPTYESVFLNHSIPVYVPAASVSTYKAANGWKDFGDNIKAIQ